MRYTLDLNRISLSDYKPLLAGQNLLPGRRMLLEEIDRRFEALCAQGIETLSQLLRRLSTPQKLAEFAAATGIPAELELITDSNVTPG